MVSFSTLARLLCLVTSSASSDASGDDHVFLLQTYARQTRTSEAVGKPRSVKQAGAQGIVGIGRYNDDYYTTVKAVTRRGTGEVALDFDAVGDSTWALQDPTTSAILWEGGEAPAEKEVYTANEKSSHIAGVLVFKDVPKDKKISFRFGAGGFSPVHLGVLAEESESHSSSASKTHEHHHASRNLKSEGHASSSRKADVDEEQENKDEDEDVDKDEEEEDSEPEEAAEEETNENLEDSSADDESEEHEASLMKASRHKTKHHGTKRQESAPSRGSQDVTEVVESSTMIEMSSGVVDALRRLESFEHQLAEVRQSVDKKAAEQEQIAVERLASKNLRLVKPIIFIKTHRTGASTIVSLLHRIGDNRDMNFMLPPVVEGHQGSPSFGWPGAFPGSDALATIGAPEHQYDVICSNAVFDTAKMLAYVKHDPFVFTVLRNPASQAVSAFGSFKPPAGSSWAERINWLKTFSHSARHAASELQVSATPSKHKKGHHSSHAHSHDDEVVALQEARLQAQFLNPQAHDLGWYERLGGSHASDHDKAAIAEWVSSLDEQLGFVLLTEHFKEGLVLLSRRLGVGLEAMAHFNMKVMAQKDKLQSPSPEEVNQLQDLYPVDTALYAHFNDAFWREWRAEGGYPAMQDQIDMLNQMNGKIAGACAKGDAALCPWRVKADDDQYVTALRQKQASSANV